MALISRSTKSASGTGDFSSGPILASEMNADLNTITDAINGGLDEANLADNAVTAAKLQTSSVTSAKIADAAVTTPKITDGAVTTEKLPDAAVTSAKLASGAAVGNIDTGTITNGMLASGAVSTLKIVDDTVTTNKLVNGSVTLNKLAPGATVVTTATGGVQLSLSANGTEQTVATTTTGAWRSGALVELFLPWVFKYVFGAPGGGSITVRLYRGASTLLAAWYFAGSSGESGHLPMLYYYDTPTGSTTYKVTIEAADSYLGSGTPNQLAGALIARQLA